MVLPRPLTLAHLPEVSRKHDGVVTVVVSDPIRDKLKGYSPKGSSVQERAEQQIITVFSQRELPDLQQLLLCLYGVQADAVIKERVFRGLPLRDRVSSVSHYSRQSNTLIIMAKNHHERLARSTRSVFQREHPDPKNLMKFLTETSSQLVFCHWPTKSQAPLELL